MPGSNFRLTLWIFMTFVVGYALVYVITHGGETWKIVLQSILFIFGLTVCLLLYRARKKD